MSTGSVRAAVAEAKTKSARNADIAFIESFEQPIRVRLRDHSVRHSLLNARTHFSYVGRLDGVFYSLHIYIGSLSQLVERLATLQSCTQFISCHVQGFCGSFQFSLTQPSAMPITGRISVQWCCRCGRRTLCIHVPCANNPDDQQCNQ